MVEFVDHDSIQNALSIFNANHQTVSFSIIKNLKHMLSNHILSSHHKRTHSYDFDHQMISFSSPSPLSSSTSFHLKHIPKRVNQDDIKKNLSYYGNIDDLYIESSSPDNNHSDYLITFTPSSKLHFLSTI